MLRRRHKLGILREAYGYGRFASGAQEVKSEMASKCRNLRSSWRPTVVILITLFLPMASVSAGTWRDDFEDDSLDGWALRNPDSTWTVQNGFVCAQMLPHHVFSADFLEFTAFPGPYERFTITLTDLSNSLFIGLSKMFIWPVTGRQVFYFYIFSTAAIDGLSINRLGGSFTSGFRNQWLPRNPGTLWEDDVAELQVHFDSAHFQLFADGELRADFEDSHFDQIDFATILIVGEGGDKEQRVDAFEISGPGIGVQTIQPKEKLATSWGAIRIHSLR